MQASEAVAVTPSTVPPFLMVCTHFQAALSVFPAASQAFLRSAQAPSCLPFFLLSAWASELKSKIPMVAIFSIARILSKEMVIFTYRIRELPYFKVNLFGEKWAAYFVGASKANRKSSTSFPRITKLDLISFIFLNPAFKRSFWLF